MNSVRAGESTKGVGLELGRTNGVSDGKEGEVNGHGGKGNCMSWGEELRKDVHHLYAVVSFSVLTVTTPTSHPHPCT